MCTLRGNEAPLKRGCRFVLPAAFCRTMSTAGGAGETAPYADFNVHIDECVSLASEVVGSVVDGVDYRAKQKRGGGRNSKRKRARNRPTVFKVSALSQAGVGRP